jgi:hypothetical protein
MRGLSDKDVKQSILDALETIQPPSKWREALIYFSIGLAGGVGVGILISFMR